MLAKQSAMEKVEKVSAMLIALTLRNNSQPKVNATTNGINNCFSGNKETFFHQF